MEEPPDLEGHYEDEDEDRCLSFVDEVLLEYIGESSDLYFPDLRDKLNNSWTVFLYGSEFPFCFLCPVIRNVYKKNNLEICYFEKI